MREYEGTVRVQVRRRGQFGDVLELTAELEQFTATDALAAAFEALRQAPGDIAVELGRDGRGG